MVSLSVKSTNGPATAMDIPLTRLQLWANTIATVPTGVSLLWLWLRAYYCHSYVHVLRLQAQYDNFFTAYTLANANPEVLYTTINQLYHAYIHSPL